MSQKSLKIWPFAYIQKQAHFSLFAKQGLTKPLFFAIVSGLYTSDFTDKKA